MSSPSGLYEGEDRSQLDVRPGLKKENRTDVSDGIRPVQVCPTEGSTCLQRTVFRGPGVRRNQ